MSNYTILLSSKAQKQLDKLADNVLDVIIDKIKSLETEPRPNGYVKLKNRNGYRVRCGNYRIIYDILDTELIVEVIALGHRKDIYK